MSEVFNCFWEKHPALLFGCFALLGIGFHFSPTFSLIFLFLCILTSLPFIFSHSYFKFFLALTITTSFFLYGSWMSQYPDIPEKGLEGIAFFNPTILIQKSSSIGKQWNFRGRLTSFQSSEDNLQLQNIPIVINLPNTPKIRRPPANKAYQIKGRLKKLKNTYVLIPSKEHPWEALKNSWSFTELRFQMKKRVSNYIAKSIKNEPSKGFLVGISTGDFENRFLSFELGRFGLQHIMAISGFHFAIVASILSFFLSPFIGQKLSCILLMLLLTLYFLFLGNSPSIIRAWISCMLGYCAFLLEKRSSGLNSLGIGLLVVLIIDPHMANSIGFQFSFAVTTAILLLFAPFDHLLQTIFPKRFLGTVIEMNTINQYGFIALVLIRQALALCMAVNAVALPMTLFYFGKFPLMSILYNFFFPWLVSLSMFFLLIGMLLDLVHIPFAHWMHSFNASYTEFVLNYAHKMPHSIDVHLNLTITAEFLIIYLTILFIAGIHLSGTRTLPEDLPLDLRKG